MAATKPDPSKSEAQPKRRSRENRPFPSCSFAEAEAFAKAIYDVGSGQPVRRLTLFNELGKSPESSASREIITNAGKYGLTKGGYQAEALELTADAIAIFSEATNARERARIRIRLAIDSIPAFRALYEKTRGLKRPANSVLIDAAREAEVPDVFLSEAVDRFIVNLENVGLIQTLSGAERILEIDHAVDQFASRTVAAPSLPTGQAVSQGSLITAEKANFETMCFYITPIGDEGSPIREHADLFLGSIVEPAVDSLGLTVVRADKIDRPGTITKQVFEYIRKARIVVADLSMHNPNVFYELAVRHMLKKPVVQISQIGDKPPFDISQMRTIFIDNSSIYKLVPKLETYRSEIANQIRSALENPDGSDNPIAVYYPDISITSVD
ncbi:MAG: hypothetical protein JHC81_05515 [Brevundimonas sp.]|uniref:hypothetical protein n=1 Tax=Brevundimonas sp. TaxID=1871086 RepID=UPI001A31D734|nr:hypothetical protein [Brevundimonas sp.]MBJ7446973.1 hypothetical protein [Brevundimonas sp.]